MAVARNPEALAAMAALGHEIASHGWRWINYHGVDEGTEREHVRLAVEAIRRVAGVAPLGWYTGRTSENTRRLVAEHGGFLYDADSYSDDLPYWEVAGEKPVLIVPYALDTNDMRFAALARFLDHVQKHDRVWICRRVEIARHWAEHYPFLAPA